MTKFRFRLTPTTAFAAVTIAIAAGFVACSTDEQHPGDLGTIDTGADTSDADTGVAVDVAAADTDSGTESDADDVVEVDTGKWQGPPSGTIPARETSTFVSSEPADQSALTIPPEAVIVRFSSQLGTDSDMIVWRNGVKVSSGSVTFAADGKSMSIAIDPPLPTGVYDVEYRAVAGQRTEVGRFVFYVEILEYEGQELSSVIDFRENSIKGPIYVNLDVYRLEITGLVAKPLSLAYAEVLAMTSESRVMDLTCVEGWTATPLWTGVPLMTLINAAEPQEGAVSAIFTALDGFDDFLPFSYITDHNIMLAHTMNEVALPAVRGFPFQVAAEGKWGYKWVKWVTKIEVTDKETYKGYWEQRGYSVDGDLDKPFF